MSKELHHLNQVLVIAVLMKKNARRIHNLAMIARIMNIDFQDD